MKQLRYGSNSLDSIDKLILDSLIANSRISNAALARKVKLSAPSIVERIKRLEEANVIEGFTVKINPEALGLSISTWIRIKPLTGQLTKVVEVLQSLPEIVECDLITGDDCFIAKAHIKSIRDLESLINQIIPYATTNTSIIQSSPVEKRLPVY